MRAVVRLWTVLEAIVGLAVLLLGGTPEHSSVVLAPAAMFVSALPLLGLSVVVAIIVWAWNGD